MTSTIPYGSPWIPLLTGDFAEAARASVHEIAAALAADVALRPPASAAGADLSEGMAGIAVFFAYAQKAGLGADGRDHACACLDKAIAALAEEPMEPSLFNGFPGVAWAMQHIGVLRDGGGDERCAEIDSVIEPFVARSPWRDSFDLIGGLAGLGVYCLERGDAPSARRALEAILDRLAELAGDSGGEASWFTGPALLPAEAREFYPEGYYNLGVAHGAPGIIALLARMHAASIAAERTGPLLERAVRWLLCQQLPAGADSCFPGVLVPGQAPGASALGWCYGDLGVAAALLRAARAAGRRDWAEAALAIARHAAQRGAGSGTAADVSFCHGTAGLAHMFNRLHQTTGDEAFAVAARYWFEQTLAHRQPGRGAAGYVAVTRFAVRDGEQTAYGTRLGLLTGIAGAGLSLLAAVTEIEPLWDRIFLVDLPPLAAGR